MVFWTDGGTILVVQKPMMEWFSQPMKEQILTFPINVRTILELLSALIVNWFQSAYKISLQDN